MQSTGVELQLANPVHELGTSVLFVAVADPHEERLVNQYFFELDENDFTTTSNTKEYTYKKHGR